MPAHSRYGETQLEFFLEASALEEMTNMSEKMDAAKDVYVGVGGEACTTVDGTDHDRYHEARRIYHSFSVAVVRSPQ